VTPREILLWDIFNDDVPITSNDVNVCGQHIHEVHEVDDEENGATRGILGITSSWEVVTGLAVDIMTLD
jgi:hypothetical protein